MAKKYCLFLTQLGIILFHAEIWQTDYEVCSRHMSSTDQVIHDYIILPLRS